MPTISFPVVPPPVTPSVRSSPEADLQNAVAKPAARDSVTPAVTVATAVTVAPAEAASGSDATSQQSYAQREANAQLSIEFDKDAGTYVYSLIDPTTHKVVREIPTEEALRRIKYLRQNAGLKVDQQT